MNFSHRQLCLALVTCIPWMSQAQNVGINTNVPVRSLEIYGALNQHVRVQTTATIGSESNLELLTGPPASTGRDYKIANDVGVFKIMTGTDDFATEGNELWRINASGDVGIGTTTPTSRVHIEGGQEASNTGDGHLLIGTKAGANIVMDQNEILSRNNGSAYHLSLQSHGGDTHIGDGGGNTYIGGTTGNLGIGLSAPTSRLTIEDEGFQIALRNTSGGLNDWYIGASNTSWIAGDNQLLFSPSPSSDDAVLRMLNVTENGGAVAPVMLRSSATQIMLLDGNEIDTKSEPLYINHNSDQETYINPSGGRVGMGNTNPSTTLHVTTQEDEYAIRLQRGSAAWDINPVPAYNYLGFIKGGWTLANVNGASGQWVTISDRRLKENIFDMPDVMDKINKLDTYSYAYRHDPSHRMQTGVIAQEIAGPFPELVRGTDGQYTVAYSKLSVYILKALQEQQEEIDILEKEILALLAAKEK
ncbi:MAG TPA: tail fiber domain-containing protein [Saprospiraceae bacterium]|nr:tail fiber domain-containing protein [Saprospiraceae bacterium]